MKRLSLYLLGGFLALGALQGLIEAIRGDLLVGGVMVLLLGALSVPVLRKAASL